MTSYIYCKSSELLYFIISIPLWILTLFFQPAKLIVNKADEKLILDHYQAHLSVYARDTQDDILRMPKREVIKGIYLLFFGCSSNSVWAHRLRRLSCHFLAERPQIVGLTYWRLTRCPKTISLKCSGFVINFNFLEEHWRKMFGISVILWNVHGNAQNSKLRTQTQVVPKPRRLALTNCLLNDFPNLSYRRRKELKPSEKGKFNKDLSKSQKHFPQVPALFSWRISSDSSCQRKLFFAGFLLLNQRRQHRF